MPLFRPKSTPLPFLFIQPKDYFVNFVYTISEFHNQKDFMRYVCFTILFILLSTLGASASVPPGKDAQKNLRVKYLEQRKNDPTASPEVRLNFINALFRELASDPPRHLYIEKGNLLRKMGKPEEALAVYNEGLNKTSPDSIVSYLKLLNEKTGAAVEAYHFTEGLESAYTMMATPMPDSLLQYGIMARLNLVNIYRRFRNPKNAEKYLKSAKEALKNAQSHGMPRNVAENYQGKILRNEALLDIELNNVEEAAQKIEIAQKLDKDSVDLLSSLSILALISLKRHEYEEAEYYFHKTLELNIPHSYTLANTYYLISLLVETGRIAEAEELIKTSAPLLERMKGGSFDHMYYYLQYNIARDKGDIATALQLLDKAYNANDSINLGLLLINSSEVAGKYELEFQQKEFDSIQRKEKIKTFAIIGLLCIVLAVIAWVAVLIRRQRGNHDEIESLQETITSIDERHGEEMQETKTHLDERNRKMASMALNLAMVDSTLNDIKSIAGDYTISKTEALSKIQKLLMTERIQHRAWEVFKESFEEINPDFFGKLYRVCPTLSNAEIRMASFMLLNLPMSTVADMTNRSVRTVGTIRYNVRRKLCITGSAEAWMTRLSLADDEEIERLARIVREKGPASKDSEPEES